MMASDYELHKKAIEAIEKNRLQFVEKMDTILILNTNVISNRLHISTKQQIESALTYQGQFIANCKLLDYLCKFDSGGIDLSEAFRETKYKGPHYDLNLVIQKAMCHTSTSNRCPVSESDRLNNNRVNLQGNVPKTPEVKLLTAVQETRASFSCHAQPVSECEEIVTTPVQCPENHLTELTSTQYEAAKADSTTCNVTSQHSVPDPQTDINKSHNMQFKEEGSKQLEVFLNPQTPDVSPEENMSSTTNETMSESFFIGSSQLRQVFCEEEIGVEHEIENLKLNVRESGSAYEQIVVQNEGYNNDSMNSQTDLKRTQSGGMHEGASDQDKEAPNMYSGYEVCVNPEKRKEVKNDDNSWTTPKQLDCEYESGDNAAGIKKEKPSCSQSISNADETASKNCNVNVNSNDNSEHELQNSAYSSNMSPSVRRLQSCPSLGIKCEAQSGHSFGDESCGQRMPLGRPPSLPAGRSNHKLFNSLFEKPRLCACKGIAGNL